MNVSKCPSVIFFALLARLYSRNVHAMTGPELRELRKAAGLSMKQAAELSGTPYRTWQDWERGVRRVPGIAVEWLKLYTK